MLEEFEKDPERVAANHIFDQDFVSATIKPLTFFPPEWCVSFKKQCMKRPPLCWFTTPQYPPGTRIVVFHGHPKPPDAARGCLVRGGIKYCRATPWVRDNWR